MARPKSQPPAEYLRLLDELIECRDDESLNCIRAKIQDQLNRHFRYLGERGFVERYNRVEASYHLHWTAHRMRSPDDRFKFCLMIQNAPGAVLSSTSERNKFIHTDSSNREIQVSVFVDARQYSESPECIQGTQDNQRSSVVRLQTLDECKNLWGDARKLSLKETTRQGKIMGDGRIALCGDINQQREFALSFPMLGEDNLTGIQLDEIEYQVIQGRGACQRV